MVSLKASCQIDKNTGSQIDKNTGTHSRSENDIETNDVKWTN